MNILKKPWFIPIVLTVIIIVAGQLYTSGKLTKAEVLPEQDIRSQLETIYDGEVKELILDGSVYKAKVTKTGAEYDVEVDAATGKVLSLFQTKEKTKPDIVMGSVEGENGKSTEKTVPSVEKSADKTEQANSGTEQADNKAEEKSQNKVAEKPKPAGQPAKQEKQSKRVLISEQQAMNIGLAQLPAGTIAEVDDVDFVNSADGGYYLVQIDIDTEDDMDEVTYQIHAITGKVITVSWEEE